MAISAAEKHRRYYAKHGDAIKSKQAEWYRRNREMVLALAREYRASNKEAVSESKRKYYEANKKEHIAKGRARKLLKLYGIGDGGYERLLEAQKGGCAICGATDNGAKKNFHIDHCHESGRVRGLLCTKCNTGIGLMGTRKVLAAAASYLERNESNGI